MEPRATYLVSEEFVARPVGEELPEVARDVSRTRERDADLAAFKYDDIRAFLGETAGET